MEIQKLKEHSSPTAQHFFASSRMNLQQTPFIQLLLEHIYSIATTKTVQQRESCFTVQLYLESFMPRAEEDSIQLQHLQGGGILIWSTDD